MNCWEPKGWGVFFKPSGILVTEVFGSSQLAGFRTLDEACMHLLRRGARMRAPLSGDARRCTLDYGRIPVPEKYD